MSPLPGRMAVRPGTGPLALEMRHPLDYFLNPQSVAVIGASTRLHTVGGRRWRSLVEAGFLGPLYPIHPTAAEVLGRKAYRSIHDVPGPVDLAVILVRSSLVPELIRDCAALKIPAVVVITAGFGETGLEGKQIEQNLVRIVRERGGRMIGPNCAGLFSASGRVNVLGWHPPPGPIALISQSGNMALTFAQFAREKGLGFSKLITVGNAADLRISECLEFLLTDDETKVIIIYLEGFRSMEGRALYELMRSRDSRKPIIVFKPGQTETGRRAALSHTGVLAGEDRIVEAALRQCGTLRVAESEEAWDAALALATLPPLRMGTVAIISDGGGHATIVADTADRLGLRVPALSEATQQALAKILPARSAVTNPVDFAGLAEEEPEVVPRALEVCLADPQLGGAIVAGHFGGYFKIATEELGQRERTAAREFVEVVRRHAKPVIIHTIYGGERLPALEELREAAIPVYGSLEASARAMASLWHWTGISQSHSTPLARRSHPDPAHVAVVLERAASHGPQRLLLEPEARELLDLYGLPVPPFRITDTPEETAKAASDFGGPVVLKLVAPGIVHKSEIGGVLLNVSGSEAARAGHRILLERARQIHAENPRVLVTPMITGGIEIVIGAFRDPQFGPVAMLGLGGVFVEALNDVELVIDRPEVAELDLNPVFLLSRGAAIADVRFVLD
ncbi:MAG: acetate--CoA ligase family protein [Candidatus Rokubacteria bacterium]|nr:acetate--CoA ligase family protein [Candidatus Rokubacteria bacterium]